MPIILKFHHLFYGGKVVHKRTKKIALLIIFFLVFHVLHSTLISLVNLMHPQTCCFNERQFSKKIGPVCVFQQQEQEHLIQNASGTLKAC